MTADATQVAAPVEAPPPSSLRVYLDQNILSDMAKQAGGWRASEVGKVLSQFDCARVWLSPTHVVELLLFPDLAGRTELARTMLDLSDASRMGPDYAYEVIEGFIAHVQTACPAALLGRKFLDHACETDKQLFLGALALLACGRVPRGEVVLRVTRLKVENRWLRARAGADPEAWLKRVQECAAKLLLVPHDPVPELKQKTDEDLAREIWTFEEESERLPQDRRRALQKHKADVVRAYAVADTLEALNNVFGRLPADIIFTLNIPLLHEEWVKVERALKCRKLPPSSLDGNVAWMLEELAKSLWRGSTVVTAAEIAQEVVLHHYVERLSERGREKEERRKKGGGGVPTDSLTFDADHAAFALRRAHVFVTRDRLLGEVSTKLAKDLGAKMGWTCRVVPDAADLGAALEELTKAS